MKHKHSLLRRALSIVLSFAIMLPASLTLIGDSGSAHAAGTKASIRVLAIEPSDSDLLTTATVASWGYTGAVSITYVSTLEFNGCAEDLEENYDLIYVGDNNTDNSGLRLDSSYLYANIGTTTPKIPDGAVGLIDEEYSSTPLYQYPTYFDLYYPPKTTRYSGNDLTPIQLAALNEYAVTGHPVIYGNALTSGTVRKASNAVTFQARISGEKRGKSAFLTANVTVASGTLPTSDPSYKWYRGNTLIDGAISSTYYATRDGNYSCVISYTVNGMEYPSRSNRLAVDISDVNSNISLSGSGTDGVAYFNYYGFTLTYEYFVDASENNTTITDINTRKFFSSGNSATYTYQWYKSGGTAIPDATSNTYEPLESGGYYCETRVASLEYFGQTYYPDNPTPGKTRLATATISATVDFPSSTTNMSQGSIPAFTASNFTINTAKVDDCSNMFRFLHDNKDWPNVMRSVVADIDKTALLNAINLSKPTINFPSNTSYPTVYTGVGGPSLSADVGSNPATYTLSYAFTIENDTDATPADTSYYCYLYIDSNADSKYTVAERVSNLAIKKASDNSVVTSGNLKAGTAYIAARTMPASTMGIIPWKLEVIKTTDEGVHASKFNYTRIPTSTDKTINILQINASGGIPLDNTGDSFPSSTSRSAFLSLFSDVSTNSDYSIKIQTVTTVAVNAIGTSSTITNKLDGKNIAYSNITAFLNSYDMILLGVGGTDTNYFDASNVGDGITDYDLNEATVRAIVEYLKSRPVLFTHDTTSWMNLPYPYEATWDGYNQVYSYYPFYGYFINTILRDSLGLDRFGVTDDTYGHTKKSNPSLPASGLVAKGYSGITADDKTAIASAGYSIAYSPGTNKATTVTATQGFSNYIFTISHSSTATTTTVSQVNEGQIAKYPYAINSDAFSRATGATVTVSSTHSQCYQVNMNTSDTTVWYCLNGGTFKNNDVSNAPYIYKHGNATYSGFGNTTSGITATSAEAKLFVNTIIAASGVSRVPPEVKFSDITGNKVVANCLLPADNDGVLKPTGSTSTDRNLYFTITDTNSGAKTITAVVSYGTTAGTSLSVNIYNSQTNAVTSAGNFVSGIPYYVKIDNILTALGNLPTPIIISDNGTPIYVTVQTTVGGVPIPPVTTSVTLRKLMLFNLR